MVAVVHNLTLPVRSAFARRATRTCGRVLVEETRNMAAKLEEEMAVWAGRILGGGQESVKRMTNTMQYNAKWAASAAVRQPRSLSTAGQSQVA